MTSVTTGRVIPRSARAGAAAVGLLALAAGAHAVEFLDGRVQIHGFGEVQVRALDEKFAEELDLAQWYNVLNVELEFDIAPDGFGPFDLASAYVRGEVRYDAIYSEGFGMFPSVNTFGNDAERLPLRLRDAIDKTYGGNIRTTDRFGDFGHLRIEDEKPAPLVPGGERLGFPGYSTFFRQFGPDNIKGPNPNVNRGVVQLGQSFDDPAWYVHEKVLDFKFAFKDFRGTAGVSTQIVGPWLPRNYVRSIALNPDRGNPLRGRVAPTSARVFTAGGWADSPDAIRYYQGDPALVLGSGAVVDRLDPMLAQILGASDSVWTGTFTPGGVFVPTDTSTVTPGLQQQLLRSTFLAAGFGGDFLGGIAACHDPADSLSVLLRAASTAPIASERCIWTSVDVGPDLTANTADDLGLYTDPVILGVTRMTGGGGENPYRVAPDVSNLGRVQLDAGGNVVDANPDDVSSLAVAQGLFYPSPATRKTVAEGRLDKPPVNFSEGERAWNHGDAQERTKELKEAYVDLELLDSRLWLRLGLQNIVWGKTELFRTTDQFNPQDLALASLPSLEESRLALWAARAVYSLYDVGPLEDVRVEFAANLDQYQNADLGACGEPFTPDVACGIPLGLWAHSLLGIGLIGIDRPESPWKEVGDLEIGGRIEWRWDRFSFALTDFYGFNDFPYPESISYYERAVDATSGLPLVARMAGERLGSCSSLTTGEVSSREVPANSSVPAFSTGYAMHPLSVTTGAVFDDGESVRGGIGTDPGCLRPGGLPGGRNALIDFDDAIDDDLANTNALQWHSANQQLFSWICSGTIGIAAALDASACAWTIFSTPEVLLPGTIPLPFSELIVNIMAGSQAGGGANGGMSTIIRNTQHDSADITGPFVALNSLSHMDTPQERAGFSPLIPLYDRNGDGVAGDGPNDDADCASADPAVRANCDIAGFDGFDARVALRTDCIGVNVSVACSSVTRTVLLPGGGNFAFDYVLFQTLDNSLTNEQRALLGCGPFFGTRCDSSANVNTLTQGGVSGAPLLDPDPKVYARAGGLDFLNMEASALMQAWPGIEGTSDGHTTWASLDDRMQPATVASGRSFLGGPVCTQFVESIHNTVKLPGCRGIERLTVINNASGGVDHVEVKFEQGYLPSIDGCTIGSQIIRTGGGVVPVQLVFDGETQSPQLVTEFPLCNRAIREQAVPQFLLNGYNAQGQPILTANTCPPATGGARFGLGEPGTPPAGTPGVEGAGQINFLWCASNLVTLDRLPMIHPTAGCIDSAVWFDARADNVAADTGLPFGGCEYFYARDLTEEFFAGNAAFFQNELAAFSWNFMLFLAATSCNEKSIDLDGLDHSEPNAPTALRADPTCFDAERPWTPGRCSLATPQFCSNVKGFLGAAGVRRNTVRAGGNGAYGRRTFVWHGGGEAVLTYEQRNVLGLSADFAEDVTKTNWGVEFTWIEDIPFANSDSVSGISFTDAYNLTVSVDRPTFINFLNPNRTFFFNSQWFFNYLPDYDKGFTFNGNYNILFTFAMFTGYFQDRVLPQLVTVYDIHSTSGGLLPSLQYRFTESFSVTIGLLYFWGRTQMETMPINELGPPSNRTGKYAYDTGVDNVLSVIRKRDEVFLRLRWTF
jgi:hypothetical protein